MLTNRFAYLTLMGFGDDVLHPDLITMKPKYKMIRDCLDNTIKEQGLTYLPDPSEGITDEKMKKMRYDAYLQRATYMPVVSRTQEGLVAQVYVRDPTKIAKPKKNEELLDRVSTQGHDVKSVSQVALGEIVAFGRGAFVVLYSEEAQRPFIDFVQTEDILTSAETTHGVVDSLGRNHASVIIRKFHDALSEDGVSTIKIAQLIQFTRSRDGTVWMRTKHSSNGVSSMLMSWSAYELVRVGGVPLRHIPVFPIGAKENTYKIQKPPLGEMAELNLSHYINSADYEEHAKLAGQVTPVFSGLKSKWYKDHIEGKVLFGMRTPVGLNEGADAKLLQAQPNSVAKEAMDKKEAQMVAIGARLIEERKIRRTATEADIESQSYHSILGHIAQNVEKALNDALDFYGEYFKLKKGSLGLVLNKEFATASNDAEHRRLIIEEYNLNLRTFKETRAGLRNYDATVGDDDDLARAEILADATAFKKKLSDVLTPVKPDADNSGKPKTDNRTKATQPKATKED